MTYDISETVYEETELHCERVACISAALAKALGEHPVSVEKIYNAALFHDEGKRYIPEATLNLPRRLTTSEYAQVQQHTKYGAEALRKKGYGKVFVDAALYHHERYDGSGYPEGLRGDEIPKVARLVAVADFYDALTAKRVYKDPVPHDVVMNMIMESSGKQFDPMIVDAFRNISELIRNEVELLDAHNDVVHLDNLDPENDINKTIKNLENQFGPLHLEDGMFLCNEDKVPIAVIDGQDRLTIIEENTRLDYKNEFAKVENEQQRE